jgi:hypothetical protein
LWIGCKYGRVNRQAAAAAALDAWMAINTMLLLLLLLLS